MATPTQEPAIARTERGLTIVGTRVTLYDVIDFLQAGYPAKLVRDKFDLTEAQINAALAYIEANRADVEAEYQQVLETREEIYQYWQARNCDRFEHLAATAHEPEQEMLWAKLEKQKRNRALVRP